MSNPGEGPEMSGTKVLDCGCRETGNLLDPCDDHRMAHVMSNTPEGPWGESRLGPDPQLAEETLQMKEHVEEQMAKISGPQGGEEPQRCDHPVRATGDQCGLESGHEGIHEDYFDIEGAAPTGEDCNCTVVGECCRKLRAIGATGEPEDLEDLMWSVSPEDLDQNDPVAITINGKVYELDVDAYRDDDRVWAELLGEAHNNAVDEAYRRGQASKGDAGPYQGPTLYHFRCGWCGAYEGEVSSAEPCPNAVDSGTGESLGPHQFGISEEVTDVDALLFDVAAPSGEKEILGRVHAIINEIANESKHTKQERFGAGMVGSTLRRVFGHDYPVAASKGDAGPERKIEHENAR